jgi:hypothetical protein
MKNLNPRLLVAVAALGWITGCASIGPPLPPSLELPRPPSDLRAARKGNVVRLTWTIAAQTTDRQSVRYLGKTLVCRSLDPAIKQCGVPVGEAVPPADLANANKSKPRKVSASFTDTLPSAIGQEHPTGFATYAVEVLNKAGRGAGISNQAHVALVPTFAPFGGFRAQATAQGILISWQCPPVAGTRTGITYLFRIYRRLESSLSETRIAEIHATSCAAGPGALVSLAGPPSSSDSNVPDERNVVTSFLDQTFEWEKTYFYRGTVVSRIQMAGKPAIEVEGDDTVEEKVFAHDIFPPFVPAGLQAVFSGAAQQPFIDLIWAPVTDADLEGYNVYRHEEGAAGVKLNSEPIKTPAFRDTQVAPGKIYFYSVTAVDQRGNESARSEEGSEKVP